MISGTERHPSSPPTLPDTSSNTGLKIVRMLLWWLATKKRSPMPIWVAARPIPSLVSMILIICSISFFVSGDLISSSVASLAGFLRKGWG